MSKKYYNILYDKKGFTSFYSKQFIVKTKNKKKAFKKFNKYCKKYFKEAGEYEVKKIIRLKQIVYKNIRFYLE